MLLLDWFVVVLAERVQYEFVQSVLARFLRLHGVELSDQCGEEGRGRVEAVGSGAEERMGGVGERVAQESSVGESFGENGVVVMYLRENGATVKR